MEFDELIQDVTIEYLDGMSYQLYKKYAYVLEGNKDEIKKADDKIDKINTGFFKNVFTEDEIYKLSGSFDINISEDQFLKQLNSDPFLRSNLFKFDDGIRDKIIQIINENPKYRLFYSDIANDNKIQEIKKFVSNGNLNQAILNLDEYTSFHDIGDSDNNNNSPTNKFYRYIETELKQRKRNNLFFKRTLYLIITTSIIVGVVSSVNKSKSLNYNTKENLDDTLDNNINNFKLLALRNLQKKINGCYIMRGTDINKIGGDCIDNYYSLNKIDCSCGIKSDTITEDMCKTEDECSKPYCIGNSKCKKIDCPKPSETLPQCNNKSIDDPNFVYYIYNNDDFFTTNYYALDFIKNNSENNSNNNKNILKYIFLFVIILIIIISIIFLYNYLKKKKMI